MRLGGEMWRCSDCYIPRAKTQVEHGGTWWNQFTRLSDVFLFFFRTSKVTSKIIAMGFPGRGSGACFRNPQKEASFTGMDGNMMEKWENCFTLLLVASVLFQHLGFSADFLLRFSRFGASSTGPTVAAFGSTTCAPSAASERMASKRRCASHASIIARRTSQTSWHFVGMLRLGAF